MKVTINWYRVLGRLARCFNRARQVIFGPVALTRKDLRTMVSIANQIIADNPYIEKCYWVHVGLISETNYSGSGKYDGMQCRFHTYYKVSDYFPWMDKGNLLQARFHLSVSSMDELMQSGELFSEYKEATTEALDIEFIPVLIEKYRTSSFRAFKDAVWDWDYSDLAETDSVDADDSVSLKPDESGK